MNKLKLLPIIAIILACVLAPDAHATTDSPPSPVVLPMQQQQDDQARPAQLGENRGEIPEGDSEIWTYEGQAGDILTIKAEADKPANDAEDRTGLLDMMLIVYAPDGTVIAKADDIETSIVTDSVIEGLQLPTDGTYQIEALGLEKQGSGPYTLILQVASAIQGEATPTTNSDWPTLTIENQLEETICYIYIWPTSTDGFGDEWLGTKQVIPPSNSHQWHIVPDEYNIVVSNCYGNRLDVRPQFDVTQSSTLTISPSATDGPEAQCAEGIQLTGDRKQREALPLLEASFAGRENATFTDPENEGICALWLGILRNNFGNGSGALEAYEVALDIFQANGSRVLEGTTTNNIGVVYDNQGKYEQALVYYEQTLEIRREVGDRAGEGVTLGNIGTVYDHQGKYEKALHQYQQALNIQHEVGDRAGEGVILNNIGAVYDNQGKYEQALEQYQQAFEILREVGDRASEGATANNIGEVYRRQGKYEQALEQYQQALEIIRKVGNRVGEGQILNNIGVIYDHQGKYEQALEQYEQALNIRHEVGDRAGEGTTANNIGGVYRGQGKYEQALEQYQKALEIRREVGDRAGQGQTLNNIGVVYENLAKYERALLQYEQALEILREVGDRVSEGATLNNIGAVYDNQGKYKQSLIEFKKALEIRREVGDLVGEGATLNNIGAVYDNQGKYEQALQKYEQALEIRRKMGDKVGEGATLNNIGTVYQNQGKYEQALAYYQQAFEILHEVGDWNGKGDILNNIGTVYHTQGKYELALQKHEQALEIRREVGDRVGEGITINNIGAVYDNQGKYEQALLELKTALKIRREVGDRAGEGETLGNIGVVYSNQGKYEKALLQYEQSLEILREVGYPVSEGATLNNIGEAYRAQEKYEQALDSYEQSLVVRREVGDRAGEGITLNNIGLVYSNQEKYEQALESYNKSLELSHEVSNRVGEGATLNNIGGIYSNQEEYERALASCQQALEIFREVGNRAGEGATLNNIGEVYEQQGQAEEALDYYEQAMDIFEVVRSTAGNDQERASFIAQYADLYDNAIGLYYEQEQDEVAFLTSERGRARSFLDSLATGKVQLSDEELQALIDQERGAYDKRFAIRDQLARAHGSSDTELVTNLEAQLEAAEQAYNEVQAAIEAQGDELAELVPGRSRVSTLAEVQGLLDEETTLLSYWVLGEEDGTLAFLITRDDLTVIELPDATPDNLRSVIEKSSPLSQWLRKNKDKAHSLSLQNLHSWLVAPLAEHLKTPKVGIIGHQALHRVPFAALTDGEGYFGEQHTLFRLPSASALSHIQKNMANLKDPTRPALVFGNPTTGEEGFGELAYAGKEAASVAELLETSVYTETDAHEARLWSEAVGAPVVHLAAHGSYNEGNALYSAIHLAPQGEYDGRLETREVYGLDLSSAEMVVLSACQTNVGETSRGDDIVGLTRAFFFAKTPTLVSSLWNVDDAATEALMSAFYSNWQGGMGKAEALQAAQAEVRANPDWAGPFYWAGFVLNGDPGEVSQSPTSGRFWMMIAGIAGLLVVVGLVISRWRKKGELN